MVSQKIGKAVASRSIVGTLTFFVGNALHGVGLDHTVRQVLEIVASNLTSLGGFGSITLPAALIIIGRVRAKGPLFDETNHGEEHTAQLHTSVVSSHVESGADREEG